jgi:hypothetical protein
MTGLVRVLLVSVSVVVLPTRVSVVVGNVSVVVPDTAGDSSVTEPEVEPLSISLAISSSLLSYVLLVKNKSCCVSS